MCIPAKLVPNYQAGMRSQKGRTLCVYIWISIYVYTFYRFLPLITLNSIIWQFMAGYTQA